MNETKNLKKLTAEEFRQPGSAYRAAPLWSWNCKMTRETIDYTLEAMKDMGMGGAHLHCRTGLDTPYLGEEFMRKATNWAFSPGSMMRIAGHPDLPEA